MSGLSAGASQPAPANTGGQAKETLTDSTPFQQLVELVRANDELLEEFQRVRSQAASAIRYLAKPEANTEVASIWLEKLRARRNKVLEKWDQNHRKLWALGLLDTSDKYIL